MVKVTPHKFPGIFNIEDNERTSLSTLSLMPGHRVYGEKTVKDGENEYRLWSPRRSKLSAAIRKGITEMPIQPGSRVLYLGAASGTTVSHVSDLVGADGIVYAVEFSPRVARDLLVLSGTRENIIPIVQDARHPERYAPIISGPIDVVFQDVAQPDQARILHENLKMFCTYGGWGMVAIKARSIDSTGSVDAIYSKEVATLDKAGFEVTEVVKLDPLEKDHAMVICRVTEAVG